MAAFREHVTVSSVLGIGLCAGSIYSGGDWSQAVLAGLLCGWAGMLPDLDSASGRPVREMMGLAAVLGPIGVVHRLRGQHLTTEALMLVAIATYFVIRFGGAWLLSKMSVHRGMFHSIPAALIAAELTYLMYDPPGAPRRLLLAGGVLFGFLSHLVLDEIYSVNFKGVTIKLSKSAGSALKFFSPSMTASFACWTLLAGLTYLVAFDMGIIQPDGRPTDLFQQAASNEPMPY